MPDIMTFKLKPANHPRTGIKAWKNPKNNAIWRAWLILGRFIIIPLDTDTAKESIASPIAMNKILKKSNQNPNVGYLKGVLNL